MVEALEALQAAFSRRLGTDLEMLMTELEFEALRQRVDDLVTSRVHPQPPDNRPPMPWPVW
jgi:hypothetical protein